MIFKVLSFGLLLFLLTPIWAEEKKVNSFSMGEILNIGNDQFIIEEYLGKGGFKEAYKARKLDCEKSCIVVIAAILKAEENFKEFKLTLNDKLAETDSPYLRREIPFVKATIPNTPGETIVSVMEYAPKTFHKLPQLKPTSYLALLDDAYQAILESERIGIYNLDFKENNFLVDGEEFTDEAIAEGRAHLIVGDTDIIEQAHVVYSGRIQGTFGRMPPEVIKRQKLTKGYNIFQTMIAFYAKMTGDYDSISPEVFNLFSNDLAKRASAERMFHKMKIEMELNLIKMIEKENDPLQKKALEKIKKAILTGIHPQHIKREAVLPTFWDTLKNSIRRNFIKKQIKDRLYVQTQAKIRSETFIDPKELEKFSKRKRNFSACSINNLIQKSNKKLILLFTPSN